MTGGEWSIYTLLHRYVKQRSLDTKVITKTRKRINKYKYTNQERYTRRHRSCLLRNISRASGRTRTARPNRITGSCPVAIQRRTVRRLVWHCSATSSAVMRGSGRSADIIGLRSRQVFGCGLAGECAHQGCQRGVNGTQGRGLGGGRSGPGRGGVSAHPPRYTPGSGAIVVVTRRHG